MNLMQLTHAHDICELKDYSILQITRKMHPEENTEHYLCCLLRVLNNMIHTEASTEIDFNQSRRKACEMAGSLLSILSDSVVLLDQQSLVFLRRIFEEAQIEESSSSTLQFIPAEKFFISVFPELKEKPVTEANWLAEYFQFELPGIDPAFEWPYAAFNAFHICCQELRDSSDNFKQESHNEEASLEKKLGTARYTEKQLRRAAKRIWSISPWTILSVFVFLFLVAAVLIPKDTTSPTDRTKAPVSYLVLSWDKAGKYGTKSHLTDSIEFRIPYGVYNVLNNNSIPVEVTVVDEGTVLIAQSAKESNNEEHTISATADNLSVGSDGSEDDDRKQHITEVTIRPNTSREIVLDEDQYLMLSEDASELIFFYLHEVPDEIDDGTTGQVNQAQAIVYAYVKGTDVRFRSSPSLEGHIINTLNNGQQVQVLGITGEWTHVKVQDQNGYIFSQYISSEDTSQQGISTGESSS